MFSDRIEEKIKEHGYKPALMQWNFNTFDFNSITEDKEDIVFHDTIDRITEDLHVQMMKEYSVSLHDLPSNVSAVLCDMAFRVGVSRTMKMSGMMGALKRENFLEAAVEALNSIHGAVDSQIVTSYVQDISGNRADLVLKQMQKETPH